MRSLHVTTGLLIPYVDSGFGFIPSAEKRFFCVCLLAIRPSGQLTGSSTEEYPASLSLFPCATQSRIPVR